MRKSVSPLLLAAILPELSKQARLFEPTIARTDEYMQSLQQDKKRARAEVALAEAQNKRDKRAAKRKALLDKQRSL